MVGEPKIGILKDVTISGVSHAGLTITTRDGRPAQLAVVDQAGNIVETGPQVASEAFNVSIAVFRNFWKGQGHLRVLSDPTQSAQNAVA